jgi:hypothetical protein
VKLQNTHGQVQLRNYASRLRETSKPKMIIEMLFLMRKPFLVPVFIITLSNDYADHSGRVA